MEFNKVRLLMFVVLLALVSVGYSRKCYVGEVGGDIEDLDCYDDSVVYCVTYDDYTFNETYFFCDYTTMCKQVGFINTTLAGVNCCDKDECNKP